MCYVRSASLTLFTWSSLCACILICLSFLLYYGLSSTTISMHSTITRQSGNRAPRPSSFLWTHFYVWHRLCISTADTTNFTVVERHLHKPRYYQEVLWSQSSTFAVILHPIPRAVSLSPMLDVLEYSWKCTMLSRYRSVSNEGPFSTVISLVTLLFRCQSYILITSTSHHAATGKASTQTSCLHRVSSSVIFLFSTCWRLPRITIKMHSTLMKQTDIHRKLFCHQAFSGHTYISISIVQLYTVQTTVYSPKREATWILESFDLTCFRNIQPIHFLLYIPVKICLLSSAISWVSYILLSQLGFIVSSTIWWHWMALQYDSKLCLAQI